MPNMKAMYKNVPALFAMFKGEPGTRKSTAALSFPKPQYWFQADRKQNSLILPAAKWNVDLDQIDYDNYSDWMMMLAKLKQLQMNCSYKTIIVDSITSVGDNINSQTLRLESGSSSKSGESKGIKVGGIPVGTFDNYKAEAAAFNELCSILQDIRNFHNCNVVLIAHVIGDRNAKDASTNTHFARIIVTGGKIISAKIPAYCDEVYHFNAVPALTPGQMPDYEAITVHTGDDFARTALPLPPSMRFNDRPLYETYIKPAIDELYSKGGSINSQEGVVKIP